jgi:hypothetical protein
VTANGQEPREPRVGGATIAAWRWRQQACALPPATENGKHANGFQATTDSAIIGLPDPIARDFAESQQAGLNALISFAKAEALTFPPGVSPFAPRPEPSASGRVREAVAATSGSGAVSARTGQVIDRPIGLVRPAPAPPARLPSTEAQTGGARASRWTTKVPWPLLAILSIQVIMALRLIWSNTAYIDEATYLYAGSQELGHWLHSTTVEDYQTFLSGSPALYPPVGAIANAIGGLVAARILSLLFMLGTSSLPYATTGRLFGKAPAALGTALFAALGVTQFLSVFATYDPMALFLLALASYLTIGRRNDGSLAAAGLSGVIAPLVLALANATKYATALWDPIIIGLAICAPVLAGRTWRYGAGRGAQLTAILAAALTIGLAMGKAKYLHGILFTTVARSQGMVGMGQSAVLVLDRAWGWAGAVFVVAAAGLVMLMIPKCQPISAVGALLLLATVAAPLSQARIGTSTSLQKHVVFGAWFGCMLAGIALARVLRHRTLIGACGVALITALPAAYARQATSLYHSWPTENSAFLTALRSMVRPGSQNYLIGGKADTPAYYVGPSVTSLQWKEAGGTYLYRDPATGAHYLNGPAFTDAIRHRAFTLVILNFTHATPNEPGNDYVILAAIQKYGGYHIVGRLPPSTIGSRSSYTVWRINTQSRPPA